MGTVAEVLDRVLVRNTIDHALDFPWVMQEIGLLGLRLDERRCYRLHVWAPDRAGGPPVIHDHPFDFSSQVLFGEVVDTRYAEDPAGTEYLRERYVPGVEDDRAADPVRLTGRSERHRAGEEYSLTAAELHDSRPLPGTVTVIRRTWVAPGRLTVCRPYGTPWVEGASRPATADEITAVTAAVRAWY